MGKHEAFLGGPGTRPDIVTVFVVDDHVLVRQAVRAVLQTDPTLRVLGDADSTLSALEALSVQEPDVATVDVRLRDSSGVDLTRAIKRYHPRVKVLALTAHPFNQYFRAMSRAGADGYIFKHSSSKELLRAIHSVHAGRTVLPCDAESIPDEFTTLTQRERQVLEMVGESMSTEQIALGLGLSRRTVTSRVGDIKSKLRAESPLAAVRMATEMGLLAPLGSRRRELAGEAAGPGASMARA